MRALLVLLFSASPAMAWDAFLQGPICVLYHEFDTARIEVTHDPRETQSYSIEITRTDTAWEPASVFSIRFEGPSTLTISTDWHQLTPDNSTVSVSDSGFGNLLDGLELSHFAIAILGDQTLAMPLIGAASEVAKFRNCTARVET